MKQAFVMFAMVVAVTMTFIGSRNVEIAKTAAAKVLPTPFPLVDYCPQKKCGSGGFFQKCVVPDEWVVPLSLRTLTGQRALFYKACGKHDDCYDTYGASKAQCDRKFLTDLEDECARAYNTIIEEPAKRACYGAARGYYEIMSGSDKSREAFAAAQDAAGRNQSYLVSITTGDVDKAGTDSRVYISLFGSNGEIIDEYVNPPGNSWERAQTDRFGIARNVGDIRRLRIRHSNTGENPGWFLEKVTIKHLKTKRVWEFPCSCWLANSHGTIQREGDVIPQ